LDNPETRKHQVGLRVSDETIERLKSFKRPQTRAAQTDLERYHQLMEVELKQVKHELTEDGLTKMRDLYVAAGVEVPAKLLWSLPLAVGDMELTKRVQRLNEPQWLSLLDWIERNLP
jgi:hypothetical protein